MLNIKTGSILEATEKYIAHQCNCITQKSAGTAKSIFDKFPYSNTYAARDIPDIMGTIKILGNGTDQRFIINMFAQYYPGKSKYPSSTLDGINIREKCFHKCLLRIAKIANLESVAFPWKIGCNLGGGNWDHYLGNIENFAKYIFEEQGATTTIYKLENL